MDRVKDGAMNEFLEIFRRDEGEKEAGDAGSRVESLPRTNAEFQSCALCATLCDQLEAQLGALVDEVLISDELEFRCVDGVRPEAIDKAVARLAASPSFVCVVDKAREAVEEAAGVQTAASSGAADDASNGSAALGAAGSFLRRTMDDFCDSDMEREGAHVKKKAARRDDWVGIIDLSGGFGGGFSPRVDIEAALGQLDAGLESPGDCSASAVEALGLLSEADPELFQFGDHWPQFLELARRALNSADPAVHAKAMTLHWVMFEKSMGMCAADMCEGVLNHARGYFASTTHVLSPAPSTRPRTAVANGTSCGDGDPAAPRLMIVGDSRLACAAREARTLHGMLVTIHETFQHLPERRVWSIVNRFFCLFGDAVASLEEARGSPSPPEPGGGVAFPGPGVESSGHDSGDDRAVPPANELSSSCGVGSSAAALLLPAHFLAVAGGVDEWLPGWLRALPTGRLVRAVNDAGLLRAMTRRCDLRGRIPFPGLGRQPHADPAVPAAAAANGADNAAASSRTLLSPSPPPPPPLSEGASRPTAAVVQHRLSTRSGSSGACSAGSAAPLGRALWLSAGELERALLLQSVSFLGILATHCRGALRPCPPLGDNEDGSEGGRPPGAWAQGEDGEEDGADRGPERGREALRALVKCARRRDTPGDECGVGAMCLPRPSSAPAAAKGAGSRSVPLVALDYVLKMAKATAGGESTPFTSPVIDCLFVPLGSAEPAAGETQGVGVGERERGDEGFVCEGGTGGPPSSDTPRLFLGALAEIAGVLLSSRGAPAGFFVDGPDGPRASRALLALARCAAELAWRACGHRGLDSGEREDWGSPPPGRQPDAPECRFRWLERGISARLAVDFARALAHVVGRPPKQRAAGWAAIRRSGVPHALAALVVFLERPRPERSASGAEERPRQNSDRDGCCPRGGGGGGGGGGGPRSEQGSTEENGRLRDRLLLSLVEWARDLVGVDLLRRAGLAGSCGSFLSRELGRRYLDRYTRDECADPRLLGVAMRLALCSEGSGELLSADGAATSAAGEGLSRLGELMDLPELLQSQAVGLPPPPHALALRSVRGHDGGVGGNAAAETVGRLAGLELGGDAGDLRCLDFICRMSLSIPPSSGSVSAGSETAQMKRWLRWGLSRVAPSGRSFFDNCSGATAQEGGRVGEDEYVAALQLVANLSEDLTTAVAIEAEWSLAEVLARQGAEKGGPLGVSTANDPTGEAEGGAGEGVSIGFDSNGGSDTNAPGIVEPAALGRARLAVLLTCLGGPNEERNRRLRRLREAEALASGEEVAAAPAALAPAASDAHELLERAEFPDDGACDEDWWEAAGRCAPRVAASLTRPRGAASTEAFSLLRKAAARRTLLLPEGTPHRVAGPAETDCAAPRGGGGKSCGGCSAPERDLSERRRAAMSKLCFSYARGLGLVDESNRDRFEAGLEAALAGAAPRAAADPTSRSPDCDWFAAALFVASGADGAATSAMLRDLRRHTPGPAFVLPPPLETDHGVAAPERPSPSAAGSGKMPPAPGAAGGRVGESAVSADGEPCAISPGCFFGDHPPLLRLVALVEEILEEELPLLSAALTASGWAAAPLAARWMRQCMLCVVDWPGVMAYVALSLLRGNDYQVYFVVALFRAAEPCIMEAASRGLSLVPLLVRGEALEGFDLEASFPFMEELERRHRHRCLAATRAKSRSMTGG